VNKREEGKRKRKKKGEGGGAREVKGFVVVKGWRRAGADRGWGWS